MLKKTALLILVFQLSGCAIPLVAGVVAVGAGEIGAGALRPESPFVGSQLFKEASWKNLEDRTTYSIKGSNYWKCATSTGRGYICVEPESLQDVNRRSQAKFACQIGQGGAFSMAMDSKNGATLFCRRS